MSAPVIEEIRTARAVIGVDALYRPFTASPELRNARVSICTRRGWCSAHGDF